MKAWMFLVIISVILITSGCCASKKFIKDEENKVVNTYLDAVSRGRNESVEFIRENLKVKRAFGYSKPYAPLVEPADIRMVWFPAHKSKYSSEVLVSGHWVYIMVRQSRWFIDTQVQDKARIPVIIPYKEETKK